MHETVTLNLPCVHAVQGVGWVTLLQYDKPTNPTTGLATTVPAETEMCSVAPPSLLPVLLNLCASALRC